jgi:hypothetical protein
MKHAHILHSGLLLGAIVLANPLQAADGVYFRLNYDTPTKTYKVYMRPTTTPTNNTVLAGAQVTIKTPKNATNPFTVSNFKSLVGSWKDPGSITPAPKEDPNSDYISFDLSSMTDFGFAANVEKLIFTFQNAKACVGAVSLMENTDPFNKLPNSASTNPGNHIAVFGIGNNADRNDYLGTYGTTANCVTAAK